jgi:hypothetical protein
LRSSRHGPNNGDASRSALYLAGFVRRTLLISLLLLLPVGSKAKAKTE